MKSVALLLYLILMVHASFAQKEIEYINPPTIQDPAYQISLDDIIAKDDYCKFKLVVNNKSSNYLAYDLSQVGFVYSGLGTYYPKKGKVKVIPPNEKMSATIRVDGDLNYMVDDFDVLLEGLKQNTNSQVAAFETATPLKSGAKDNVGNFRVEVKKTNLKKKNLDFTIDVRYEGGPQEFGTIDPRNLITKTTDGNTCSSKINIQKLRIVQGDKKLTLIGSIERNGAESFVIDWSNTFTNYTLESFNKHQVAIHRFGASTAKTTTVVDAAPTPKPQRNPKAAKIVTPTPQPSAPPAATCNAVVGNTQGKTKVNFYNVERHCFKMYVNGALISEEYSSNVTFNTGPGKKMLEFHFQNGHVFTDKIVLYPDWLESAYRVKPKGSSYTVNLNLGTIIKEETTTVTSTTSTVHREHRSTTHSNPNTNSNQVQTNIDFNGGGISITTTSSGSSSGGSNPAASAPSIRTNCHPQNVTYGQLNDIKQQIEDEITDFNKIKVAKQVVQGRCLSATQVADICRIFSMDDKRLEFAKHAYHYTYDIDNYYKVVNTLTFDMKKDELRAYTRSH